MAAAYPELLSETFRTFVLRFDGMITPPAI
jgi:hypothetical protein